MPCGLAVKTAVAVRESELITDVEVELARRAVPAVVNHRDTIIHADRADRQVETQADADIGVVVRSAEVVGVGVYKARVAEDGAANSADDGEGEFERDKPC